jgi:hypothetical protein
MLSPILSSILLISIHWSCKATARAVCTMLHLAAKITSGCLLTKTHEQAKTREA